MALNIVTDAKFDRALIWLAKTENRTKSELIRDIILSRFAEKKYGFRRGALASHIKGPAPTSRSIAKELKGMDRDHDLD